MSVIACPNCQRQYQVKSDQVGKSVKCANCQNVFAVTAQAAATQTTAHVAKAQSAAAGVGGNLTSTPGLFPDNIPAGPDPLANHVVQDPGFVDVDLSEIKRTREDNKRKKSLYDADDPLRKFKREQQEARDSESGGDGVGAAVIVPVLGIFAMIVINVLSYVFEWGFIIY